MKLAKSSTTVWAALALSFTLSSAAGAQSAPAKNASGKAKAASSKGATSATAPSSGADPSAPAPAVKSEAVTAKRDPFQPLVSNTKPSQRPLARDNDGLIIATVHVDGTVKSPSGRMAGVSNDERRVYFIREGDKLY